MPQATALPIPASMFGVVVGLAGLASGWRIAVRIWGLPWGVGEGIMAAAALLWLVFLFLYLLKWLARRDEALAEWRHPIQSGFVSLVPLTTLLMGLAVAPYSAPSA